MSFPHNTRHRVLYIDAVHIRLLWQPLKINYILVKAAPVTGRQERCPQYFDSVVKTLVTVDSSIAHL